MTRKKSPSIFNSRQIISLLIIIIVLAGIKIIQSHAQSDNNSTQAVIDGNLMTVISSNGQPSRLIHYKGMDVSFNDKLHIPNWVSWELTRAETQGAEPRYNKFMEDPNVKECPKTADYTYSGYDRGHMAPAGDMKWNRDAMKQTFYLTNICPQAKQLNTGAWKKLEEKCRVWAAIDSAIYIVCGPVLADDISEYIGQTRVAVPKRFFKVIASPYAHPPRGIGFIMPNGHVEGGMQQAAVSIDEVEALTGLNFFSQLPDSLEKQIESQNNFHQWSTLRRQ